MMKNLVTLKGDTINLSGNFPVSGAVAPDFVLVDTQLQEKSRNDFPALYLILNIFPSIDTGVCAQSVRTFNREASKRDNCTVLCISRDLPFALQRFCGSENMDQVIPLSAYRSDFGRAYGVEMRDGSLQGLLARAVIVIDQQGLVRDAQLVNEITSEPNYPRTLATLQ